jgi:hypothetical protein
VSDLIRQNAVALAVTVYGLQIRVTAGSFKVAGKDYSLEEDHTWVVTPSSTDMTFVDGYLVRDKQSGEVTLLVDETCGDEAIYDWKDSPFEHLWFLFHFGVAKDAIDLETAEKTVVHRPKPEV